MVPILHVDSESPTVKNKNNTQSFDAQMKSTELSLCNHSGAIKLIHTRPLLGSSKMLVQNLGSTNGILAILCHKGMFGSSTKLD